MIDSHCHIHYLDQPLDQSVAEAKEHGISRLLNVAVVESEWADNIALGADDLVDVGLGVHPCDVQKAKLGWQERLLKAAAEPAVVAIGETGLDYYHDKQFKKLQLEAFEDHISIAKQLSKPIIVHMRDASADTIALLQRHKGTVKGVIHCFTEDWATAKQLLDCGMLISFSGIVTFKNATAIQDAAQNVPLDRMLIETDSPYLAPTPYRGKTNKPHYVTYVANYIAKLRGLSVDTLVKQTNRNYLTWIS